MNHNHRVAKQLLDERYINVAAQKHHTSDEFQLIKVNNHTIGAFFKGKYVSVGHEISLKTALNIVEKLSVFNTP
nr:endonuclease V [uncultured Methanobacterium sp.]